MDEFDQPYRTVMDRAKAKAAETWRPEQPAPVERSARPEPMLSRRPDPTLVGAITLALVGVLALLFMTSQERAPLATSRPTSAPEAVPPPTAAPPAPSVAPVPASVEAPAPQPTGFIEPVPQPQQAPIAPAAAPSYVAPAPTASELQPITEEPSGWHPPYASGYSPDQNFVEVRP